ncbi:MAG TPA: thiamine pyrophosphate-dependent enzyme [Flavobacteriaceae bacterium]|nr:thiamine pyrophosphate-dependent enzyme [Flavobacteriaceae bacterium]
MKKKVADQLVEMLVNAGVKRVYAVTGDSLNPVNDAIRRDGRLQWIHVRHEEAGAYAASMDSELNGIGCCMGSSGPGHVHLVNGLYDANRAGNPVIVIASTINTYKLGQDNFQETNPFKLFDDCSKYVYVASTPRQFPHIMQMALQQALEQKGVAVVGLPGDVASADAEEIVTSTVNYKPLPLYRPSEEALKKLAEILNKHKKITLYCGYGSRHAVAEAKELARILNSPITYSFRGKIFYETDDNEFAAGMNGLLGHKSGYEAMKDAEVLVLLGTDFPYVEFLPQENTIVQIDHKPERLGRRAKVDLGLAGDIKDTLQALIPYLKEKSEDDFLQEQRQKYAETEKDMLFYVNNKGKEDNIHPEFVAHTIDRFAQKDAIFTVDTGMSAVWAARFIKGGKGRYLTGSFNHGSMANAMPQSIGAALSFPDRQIICFSGDGGISMLFGDLMTVVQYKLPIKIIVFNNRALGMVKLEMLVAGYPDWQTDMVNPPFDKVAEAIGFTAFEIRETKNVEPLLQKALEHPGPVLVNVYTDPNALAMPPDVEWDQVEGFLTSMVKMIAHGRTDEVMENVKSNWGHLRELF